MYDIIIIGSGIGGLSAATLLAKHANKRVLILEQHTKIGGLTHAFRRKQYEWDVGVHYVGGLEDGTLFKKLFDDITEKRLHWQKMPNPFECFIFPDLVVRQPDSVESYQSALCRQFPKNKDAIQRYFRDVKRAAAWYVYHHVRRSASPLTYLPILPTALGGKKLAEAKTKKYLEQNIPDNKLRSVLTAQWGDYGLTPDQSSFGIHALIVQHYLGGAWYPVGGAERIAAEISGTLTKYGGSISTGKIATKILRSKSGSAAGVRVADRKQNLAEADVMAPVIISDIGIRGTLDLLPNSQSLARVRNELKKFPAGPSAVTVYLGLKDSPAKLGLHGENIWINESFDVDPSSATEKLLIGAPLSAYVSFSSLKNPLAKTHTAEIIAIVLPRVFDRWAGTVWRRRGEDYEALKEVMARGLINLLNKHIPGFSGLIDYYELSTPLSIEHFTARKAGEMYGLPETPERLRIDWLGPNTPIPNLFIAGSDAFSLGIQGAFMGGVAAAGHALGRFGFERIVLGAMRNVRKNNTA